MTQSEPRTPRTEAGRRLDMMIDGNTTLAEVHDSILAIEDEAAAAPPIPDEDRFSFDTDAVRGLGAAPPIDVERLAEAIRHYKAEDLYPERLSWNRADPLDAPAIAAEYARLSGPPPEPKP